MFVLQAWTYERSLPSPSPQNLEANFFATFCGWFFTATPFQVAVTALQLGVPSIPYTAFLTVAPQGDLQPYVSRRQ